MRFKGVPEASGPITRIHSFSTCFLSIHIYQASCYLLDTVVCVCVGGGRGGGGGVCGGGGETATIQILK